jgi:hypothetical protein
MATLKPTRKIESGKIWDAYFKAAKNRELFEVVVEKKRPFGLGCYDELQSDCFKVGDKTYTATGFDHFNAHISGFTDETCIYGIYVREIV